jgi:hypothetical protein
MISSWDDFPVHQTTTPVRYVASSDRKGRVFFDTSRFAQTGCWEGTLRVGDEHFDVTPDRWWGKSDPGKEVEELGPVEYDHRLKPGTRMMTGSVLRFPGAPGGALEIQCDPTSTPSSGRSRSME